MLIVNTTKLMMSVFGFALSFECIAMITVTSVELGAEMQKQKTEVQNNELRKSSIELSTAQAKILELSKEVSHLRQIFQQLRNANNYIEAIAPLSEIGAKSVIRDIDEMANLIWQFTQSRTVMELQDALNHAHWTHHTNVAECLENAIQTQNERDQLRAEVEKLKDTIKR